MSSWFSRIIAWCNHTHLQHGHLLQQPADLVYETKRPHASQGQDILGSQVLADLSSRSSMGRKRRCRCEMLDDDDIITKSIFNMNLPNFPRPFLSNKSISPRRILALVCLLRYINVSLNRGFWHGSVLNLIGRKTREKVVDLHGESNRSSGFLDRHTEIQIYTSQHSFERFSTPMTLVIILTHIPNLIISLHLKTNYVSYGQLR